jgi:hypothetical protein
MEWTSVPLSSFHPFQLTKNSERTTRGRAKAITPEKPQGIEHAVDVGVVRPVHKACNRYNSSLFALNVFKPFVGANCYSCGKRGQTNLLLP